MHVTDGDVIEGQRVNSGVRLHEKPPRAFPPNPRRKEWQIYYFKKAAFLHKL